LWLDELKSYLKENIDYVDNYLKSNLKKIKLIKTEGTYLLWLDFKDLNLTSEEVENILLNDAKIWLDNGNMFGELGEGYQRINIALPREKLEYAMKMLSDAFMDY
ncbi:MAG: aminotransferase, partial [Bacilli bacterium]|nr:aminotransferase [Bacilli bacterium]